MEDHEVRRFREHMKLLHRRLRREALPVHGVSRTAYQVLGAVVRLPEAPRPREIADELHMTSSNVAAALRELEAAGYVLRRKDSADARRVSVVLTSPGRRVVAGVRSERDTWLGRAVETLLTEDEERTLLAAGELMRRLAEFERPNPAGLAAEPDPDAPDAGRREEDPDVGDRTAGDRTADEGAVRGRAADGRALRGRTADDGAGGPASGGVS